MYWKKKGSNTKKKKKKIRRRNIYDDNHGDRMDQTESEMPSMTWQCHWAIMMALHCSCQLLPHTHCQDELLQ
jgi:hypothetical protein